VAYLQFQVLIELSNKMGKEKRPGYTRPFSTLVL